MPCYHPITAYRATDVSPSGKRRLVFGFEGGYRDLPVTIPCGQCIGCRLDKSSQLASRIIHEASLHPFNWFVTLTYDDDHLPKDGSLNRRDGQLFMKRLRKRFSGHKIKFQLTGEYGDRTWRPHYHVMIFNLPLDDLTHCKDNNGRPLFHSQSLEDCWKMGLTWIGSVEPASAAYVAGYILKKVTGDRSVEHYQRVDLVSGEIYSLMPEFQASSRRPAIGLEWLKKFPSDVYPSDFVVIKGKERKVPGYYDKQLEKTDKVLFDKLKLERKRFARRFMKDSTPERLAVREVVAKAKLGQKSSPVL